ncbi:biotin--[acetyl-CoA-carboxylase] ligase [Pontibacter russatus]|uniref:biotin--[acetyl-CoA-carboxylase] ligase n=1 Tax=Pontibacter russatus TaxID=2694929 RepID=UPI00137B6E80|nr:biotin--[acetyl-CoA-carboxylase] ligase [Pontibacter russatus]
MLPHTLFVGQQLYFLPVCGSTNAEAHLLLIKNEATEGCTIVAGHQTQGRGQRGNTWEAEPGKNVTLSVILFPSFLAARRQFYLNMAVSLAALDLLREQGLTGAQVKWPNDLYFQDKKLGGILIENSVNGHRLQHSIVGIGLNVNQLRFESPTATSMACAAGAALEVETVTVRLLELLEKRYLQLRSGQASELRHAYLQALYRYQEVHAYSIDGRQVRAQLVGVDEEGRLALEIGNRLRYFGFKEVSYIL